MEYYASEAQNFADIYPASYGNFRAARLTGDITIFHFTDVNQILYTTHYHITNSTNPSWTQLAKQSDLINLSNSLGEAAYRDLTKNEDFLGRVPLIANDGVMEIGQYIDLHIQDSTQTDFDVRIRALSNDLAIQIPSLSKTISLVALANSSSWAISKGTNGWARESSTGFTIQWGRNTTYAYNRSVTFPRTFTTVYGVMLTQSRHDTANLYIALQNTGYPSAGNVNFKLRTTGFDSYIEHQTSMFWYAYGIS